MGTAQLRESSDAWRLQCATGRGKKETLSLGMPFFSQ